MYAFYVFAWIILESLKEVTAAMAANDTAGHAAVELAMKSTMLHHVLSWRVSEADVPDLRFLQYTVWYRMATYRNWEKVPECTDILQPICDFSKIELFPDSDYWFKVTTSFQGPPEVIYSSSTLRFRPQHDTLLLPPNITAKYMDGFIFVRPETPTHLGNGEPISAHMSNLKYQIMYWPANSSDGARNVSSADLTSGEISLKVGRQTAYCLSIRLYAEDIDEDDSKILKSNWSTPPLCIRPEGVDRMAVPYGSRTQLIAYICAGIASLIFAIGATYAAYRGCKIYKFLNEKVTFPPSLVTLFQEAIEHDVHLKNEHANEIVDDIFYPINGEEKLGVSQPKVQIGSKRERGSREQERDECALLNVTNNCSSIAIAEAGEFSGTAGKTPSKEPLTGSCVCHRYCNVEEDVCAMGTHLSNRSYSSNPKRPVPDMLHVDYVNIEDI